MNTYIKAAFAIVAIGAVAAMTIGAAIKAKRANDKDEEDIAELERYIKKLESMENDIQKSNEEAEEELQKLKQQIIELANDMGVHDEIYAMMNGIRVLK